MSQIAPIQAEATHTDKPATTSADGLDPIFLNNIKNASSDKEYCYHWLQLQNRIIPDVRNAVVFLTSTHSIYTPVSHLPDDFSVPDQYNELVQRVLKKSKGIAQRSNQKPEGYHPNTTGLLLAYPCRADSEIFGVVVLEISPRPTQEIQDAMRHLQHGVSILQSRLLKKKTSNAPKTDTISSENLMIVNKIITVILKKKQSKEATTVAVTELAKRLHCDRVSIGFRRKNQSKVAAVSDSIRFGKQMNLIRAIEEAMDESQDQIAPLSYPSPSDKDNILRAHGELARLSGAGSLLTVPFVDPDGNTYGALTFERPEDEQFDSNSISLCKSAAALIGPILNEKRLNDRSLPTKAADSFKNIIKKIFGPGNIAAKLMVFALAAFILFFTFANGQYRVTAVSVLEGTVQRALIAPFDGYLYESLFKAGDIVKQDDILARLDSRDLMLERLKWASQQKQHTLEYSKAMAENETASYKIIQEQIHQAESQLSLLEELLSRAQIRAPFKGIIISGDLSQSIGAPVERGQILFEIAPLDSYRIMLEVEEKDIDEISSGQKGTLILNALPSMSFPFSIVEMTPVSVTSQGKNVFLVEGKFKQTSDRLRPGMQGYGKIIIEKRNLLWIWTHDLVNAIKLWFWSVVP